MMVLVIGLGGVTNGGKTTLAEKLKKMLPNCDIISQDDFFKPESEVETDEHGFKLYDVLDALYMDEMVKTIRNWMKSPASSGVVMREPQSTCDKLKNTEDVYILIVEGFLLYNYEPLNELWDRRYFLTLPYEECKRRRSTRVYQPADTPGYFDGHVWPMYLKYKNEVEENANNIVYLDGTKSQEELLSCVYSDIIQELKLREGTGGLVQQLEDLAWQPGALCSIDFNVVAFVFLPMPASSKMDPLLAKAKPISDGGSTSGIT
ncbi:nicotinamide riboside kinase 1 [Grus japonensis]|uniref:Nicotinamide riboside kinase 1 n=1 Tax=Grus japonensis TaxID=30415 RepID=A0ABC9Y406_GRUJA